MTEARLDAYAKARLAEGAARQTVNNELSALRRGFNLAIEKRLLAPGSAPAFRLPKVDNARQGFFEDGDLAAVLLALPEWAQPVIRFLRVTGWRVREALTLTWDRVDWDGQVIRLTPKETKGKAARAFPFASAPDLRTLLEERLKAADGVYVFQREGAPISYDALQHRFERTCKRVGVERVIHDLRRTAVRDFIRKGVDAHTVMRLCGWRTPSMLERYHIINEQDLAAAVAKRYGTVTAQFAPSTAVPSR